jgi:hypothetical protein
MGSSGRALTYQAQGPQFKPQYCQKKKKDMQKLLRIHINSSLLAMLFLK